MSENGIQGICRRKGRKDLVNAATEEDLVKRFTVDAPDVLWLTDITEHPTAGTTVPVCDLIMVHAGEARSRAW